MVREEQVKALKLDNVRLHFLTGSGLTASRAGWGKPNIRATRGKKAKQKQQDGFCALQQGLDGVEPWAMTMTQEQQHVFEQAVYRGIVKNAKHAYEAGCAALRRQLLELREEETAKLQAAAQAEAEMIERNQLRLF